MASAERTTLENARKYRWYQIGAALRSEHPRVYDDEIRPAQERLKRHGSAVLEDLQGQVDTILALTPSLEEAGPFHQHCHRILERLPGEFPTKLQIDLEAYCWEKAVPALYLRLVTERAQKLDVRLATLRRLEVGYPGHLVGSPGFVGRADIPGAYARALEDRLNAAQPEVIADLAKSFRAKAIGDDPLQTDVTQCRDLLGPWYPQTSHHHSSGLQHYDDVLALTGQQYRLAADGVTVGVVLGGCHGQPVR